MVGSSGHHRGSQLPCVHACMIWHGMPTSAVDGWVEGRKRTRKRKNERNEKASRTPPEKKVEKKQNKTKRQKKGVCECLCLHRFFVHRWHGRPGRANSFSEGNGRQERNSSESVSTGRPKGNCPCDRRGPSRSDSQTGRQAVTNRSLCQRGRARGRSATQILALHCAQPACVLRCLCSLAWRLSLVGDHSLPQKG